MTPFYLSGLHYEGVTTIAENGARPLYTCMDYTRRGRRRGVNPTVKGGDLERSFYMSMDYTHRQGTRNMKRLTFYLGL